MGLSSWMADPIGFIVVVGLISFVVSALKWWNGQEAKARANQAKPPRLSDPHKARQVRLSADHCTRHKLPRVPGEWLFRLVVIVGILASGLRVVIALGIVASPRLLAWDDGVLIVVLALAAVAETGYLLVYPPSADDHPPVTTALPLTLVGALRLGAMRFPGLHATPAEMVAVRALIRRQVGNAVRVAAEAKYVRENNAQVLTTGELLLELLRYHITSTAMPLGIWVEGGWDDRPEGGVTAQFRLRADGGLVISDVLADAWHKVAGSANLPMTLRQDRSRVTIDADSTAVFVVLGGPTPPPPPEEKPDVEDEPREAELDLETPLALDRPPLDLLAKPNKHAPGRRNEGKGASEAVLRAMGQAGVPDCELVKVLPGPVVSTIIVRPPVTAKAPALLGMEEDLRFRTGEPGLRLSSAAGHPGCLSIEVPNGSRAMVSLSEVVASPEFRSEKGDIIGVLGVSTTGQPLATDVAGWPHALVGGQAGGGKSVFINSLLTSLILRYSPDELRLILVDPKRVELSAYAPLPHLLCPPIFTPAEAKVMFGWAVDEMIARYGHLNGAGVKLLPNYNRKVRPEERLPFVLIVVDEAQDLMSDKDAKEAVVEATKRLAAMGRASGTLLLYATQKPIVEVVPTTVKGNLATRVAFKVVTTAESGVILDQSGAETLLGMGDLLHKAVDGKITRAQSPFIDDDEIKRIVGWWVDWGRQYPEYQYDPDLMEMVGPLMRARKNGVPSILLEADRTRDHDEVLEVEEDRERGLEQGDAPHGDDRPDDHTRARSDDRGPGDDGEDGPELGGDGNWFDGDGGAPRTPRPQTPPSAPAQGQDRPRKPGLRVVSINGKVVLDEHGRNPHRTQRDGGRDR